MGVGGLEADEEVEVRIEGDGGVSAVRGSQEGLENARPLSLVLSRLSLEEALDCCSRR